MSLKIKYENRMVEPACIFRFIRRSSLKTKKYFSFPFMVLSSLFVVFSTHSTINAQEEKNWVLSGYIKNLQSVSIVKDELQQKQLFTDNLLHNRLNFKWFIDDNWTFKADARTRILYGETTRLNNFALNGEYAKQIDAASNDIIDLSAILINENAVVMHTVIDRLYLEWVKGNWEIRAGRQRINWGINTIWNPNDIFNAYSFTDFDYEERPGSDALRVQYYTGVASSIEFATKFIWDQEDAVAALLWKFNQWNYDFQLLSAYAEEDFVFGGGWAGSIKDVGFKGEWSWFTPLFDEDESDSFSATLSFDYTLKKGTFLSTGFLYNSNGQTAGSITQLFAFELSAKNLYPYQYTVFFSVGQPITPILNSSLAFIYSPSEAHPIFLNPVLTYSIKENWDIDLVGQLIFNEEVGQGYASPLQAIFGRLKFSF